MEIDDRFLVTHWRDGCAVFDRQFGDTHALDPAAAATFLFMAHGGHDRSSLMAKVATVCPEIPGQDMADRVEGVRQHLERLGLVKADLN